MQLRILWEDLLARFSHIVVLAEPQQSSSEYFFHFPGIWTIFSKLKLVISRYQ
jgi:hypothetical protein